jgi:hypothetical protein
MSSKNKTTTDLVKPSTAKQTPIVNNSKPHDNQQKPIPRKEVVKDHEEEEEDEEGEDEEEEKVVLMSKNVDTKKDAPKNPFDNVAKKRGIDDIKSTDDTTDDPSKKQKTQADSTPGTSSAPIVPKSDDSEKKESETSRITSNTPAPPVVVAVPKIIVPKKNLSLSPQYFRHTFDVKKMTRTKLRLVIKTPKATIYEYADGGGSAIVTQSPMIKVYGFPSLHSMGGLYVDEDDKAKTDTDRTFSAKFLPIYEGHPHNKDLDNEVLKNDPDVGIECKDFTDMLNGVVLDRLAMLWLEHTMDYKEFSTCTEEKRTALAVDMKKQFNTWVTKADKERGRESDEAKELFGKISAKRKVFMGKEGSTSEKSTEDKKNKSKKLEDVEDLQNQPDDKVSTTKMISDEDFAKNLDRIDQGINAELSYEEVSRILKESMAKGFTYKPMSYIDHAGNPINVINEQTGAIEQDKIKKWMHQQVYPEDYVSIKFTIRVTKLLSGTVYVSLHLYGPIQYIKNNSQYSNQTYTINVKGLTSDNNQLALEQKK